MVLNRQSISEKFLTYSAVVVFLALSLLVHFEIVDSLPFVIYVVAVLLALASILWIVRSRRMINFSLAAKTIQIPSNFIAIPMVVTLSNYKIAQGMGFPSQDFPASLAVLSALFYPLFLMIAMGMVIFFSATLYVGLASLLNIPPWRGVARFFAKRLDMPPAANMGGLGVLGALLIFTGAHLLEPLEKNNSFIVRHLVYSLDYKNLWNYPGVENMEKAMIHSGGVISAGYIDKNGKIYFKIIEPKKLTGRGG